MKRDLWFYIQRYTVFVWLGLLIPYHFWEWEFYVLLILTIAFIYMYAEARIKETK